MRTESAFITEGSQYKIVDGRKCYTRLVACNVPEQLSLHRDKDMAAKWEDLVEEYCKTFRGWIGRPNTLPCVFSPPEVTYITPSVHIRRALTPECFHSYRRRSSFGQPHATLIVYYALI